MDKTITLKTQLVVASKLAKISGFGYQRLAVIILDNFIELQLSDLIKQKFKWDGAIIFTNKKYSENKRSRILRHYEELLTASVDEKIINQSDQLLLNFCHERRNNLYHKGKEDELLIRVALIILSKIIINYQPKWKNTRDFTVYSSQDEPDPYINKKIKKSLPFFSDETTWQLFLDKHFLRIDNRKKSASQLLSEYLIEKIKRTNQAIAFLKKYSLSSNSQGRKWEYDDLLLYYSFNYIKKLDIQRIKEIKDIEQRNNQLNTLFKDYQKQWRPINHKRIKTLKKMAQKISELPIEQSLNKFISLKNEIILIYEAFSEAAGDLESEMQRQIDIMRGK